MMAAAGVGDPAQFLGCPPGPHLLDYERLGVCAVGMACGDPPGSCALLSAPVAGASHGGGFGECGCSPPPLTVGPEAALSPPSTSRFPPAAGSTRWLQNALISEEPGEERQGRGRVPTTPGKSPSLACLPAVTPALGPGSGSPQAPRKCSLCECVVGPYRVNSTRLWRPSKVVGTPPPAMKFVPGAPPGGQAACPPHWQVGAPDSVGLSSSQEGGVASRGRGHPQPR